MHHAEENLQEKRIYEVGQEAPSRRDDRPLLRVGRGRRRLLLVIARPRTSKNATQTIASEDGVGLLLPGNKRVLICKSAGHADAVFN